MNASTVQTLVALGAVVSLFLLWRFLAWKRRMRRNETIRVSASPLSLIGRVTVTAVLIVGVQWIVIVAAADNHGLVLAVLGIPALLASYTLTKALTVSTVDVRHRRGGRR